LETQDAIDRSVQWALGLSDSFLITAGDMRLLPMVLDAADRSEQRPSDAEMSVLVDAWDIEPIFW
jgi:hypothetical protein